MEWPWNIRHVPPYLVRHSEWVFEHLPNAATSNDAGSLTSWSLKKVVYKLGEFHGRLFDG